MRVGKKALLQFPSCQSSDIIFVISFLKFIVWLVCFFLGGAGGGGSHLQSLRMRLGIHTSTGDLLAGNTGFKTYLTV